jgi:hypothetical protein
MNIQDQIYSHLLQHSYYLLPIYQFFTKTSGLGVDSASNRTEYHEYFLGSKGGRCVGLTTLSPSCADCLEIWKPQPLETVRACQGL